MHKRNIYKTTNFSAEKSALTKLNFYTAAAILKERQQTTNSLYNRQTSAKASD